MLRKLLAEYYVDNDDCEEDSLNMFLIDTSSDELELKKLELKLKIEAELKQTEIKLKQEQELQLRKSELRRT